MTLIRNERLKLLANALDRVSTACIVAGIIGPLISATSNSAPFHPSGVLVLSSLCWIGAAVVLHFAARHALGRLRP